MASQTESGEVTPLESALERAERRIAALEARLARLEPTEHSVAGMEEVSSRRGLFKLAGAVATGAVAHTLLSASPAAAGDQAGTQINGNAVELGEANTATGETLVTRTSATDSAAFRAVHIDPSVPPGPTLAAGMLGYSLKGYGVVGDSGSGYALFAQGNGRIGMTKHSEDGPTSAANSSYLTGDIVRDATGNMFVCVTGGTGAGAAFRKIAGPGTAGQLHLLPTPLRAYDSRPGEPAASGGDGPIVGVSPTTPTTRLISLLNGTENGISKPAVPAGASGALFNLTITGTSVAGYLSVVAGGAAWSRASTTNWSATGQTIPGFVTSAINASAQIAVICPFNSTNFLIDVVGYYR